MFANPLIIIAALVTCVLMPRVSEGAQNGKYSEEKNNFFSIGNVLLKNECNPSCPKGALKALGGKIEFREFILNDGNLTGRGTIYYEGRQYNAILDNGIFTSSPTFLFDSYSTQVDKFEGQLKRIYDPLWKTHFYGFDEGTYTAAVGAKYTGQFFMIPTMDLKSGNGCLLFDTHEEFKEDVYVSVLNFHIQHSVPTERTGCIKVNLVFVGKIEYKGQTEIGFFAQEDLGLGQRLKLRTANEDTIELFLTESNQVRQKFLVFNHKKERERQREQNRSIDIPWGKIFSLAVGVTIASTSDLSSDRKAEFLSSYTKDVMGGTTSNLQSLRRKYSSKSQNLYDAFGISKKNFDEGQTKIEQLSKSTGQYNPFKVISDLDANTNQMIADFNASQQRQKPGAYGCKAGTVWNQEYGQCVVYQPKLRDCDKIDGRMYGRNPCATIVRNDDTKEMMPVPRADEMANHNQNTNRNSQSGPTNKPRKMTCPSGKRLDSYDGRCKTFNEYDVDQEIRTARNNNPQCRGHLVYDRLEQKCVAENQLRNKLLKQLNNQDAPTSKKTNRQQYTNNKQQTKRGNGNPPPKNEELVNDSGIVLAWQNSRGSWFGCGPVQCTSVGEEKLEEVLDYVATSRQPLRYWDEYGRCKRYIVTSGVESYSHNSAWVYKHAICK
ncbi:exported hypothetical protein [Alteromonas alvinellae]